MDGGDGARHLLLALVDPLLVSGLRPGAIIQRHCQGRRRLQWFQSCVVQLAFNGYRNHPALTVEGPGAADLFRVEGVVLGAVTVDHFDVAAPQFGP
ncbi:hypothetical protein D9M71_471930 [compost metagenome]